MLHTRASHARRPPKSGGAYVSANENSASLPLNHPLARANETTSFAYRQFAGSLSGNVRVRDRERLALGGVAVLHGELGHHLDRLARRPRPLERDVHERAVVNHRLL